MHPRLVGGIYVVEATKDGVTEYWAAATLHENAVAAVEKELGPGWTVTLQTGALLTSDFLHSRCSLTLCGSCNGAAPEFEMKSPGLGRPGLNGRKALPLNCLLSLFGCASYDVDPDSF
jgi:hypothetical protein